MNRPLLLLASLLFAAPAAAFEICDEARDATSFPPHERWAVVADQGLDGWIFGQAELEVPAPLAAAGPLARLARALAARGVAPFVVDVPLRPAVAGEKLAPRRPAFKGLRPQAFAAAYHRRMEALGAAGLLPVDVVSLAASSGLGAAMVRDRDPRWSGEGMRAVAGELAARIQALPAWASVPKHPFRLEERTVAWSGTYRYVVADRCGVPLPATPGPAFRAEPEDELAGAALLGESAVAQVVLVGTANSRRKDYDVLSDRAAFEDSFAALLRHALSARLLNLAVEGGGTYTALEAWLTGDEYGRNDPRVLIWEMADGDGFDDPAALRRIVPAAWGWCGDGDAIASAAGALADGPPSLDVDPARGVQGHQHYVAIRLSDRGLTEFAITFHQGDGAETVAMQRSRLLPNSGRFFVELGDAAAPLERVSIDLPPGSRGTWEARICAAPE